MTMRAVNLKMEETEMDDVRMVATDIHMTMTDVSMEDVKEYTTEMKYDAFYRLTANVQNASGEETAETLTEIENLSDDDLSISSVRRVSI